MRRKQTALLISLLIIGGMVFVSQIRPNSGVESTHPDDATGGGPPITDHDKDGMPDLHEEAFSEAIELSLGDRSKTINGLDWQNGSDNSSDFDLDGLTALMEFCWPYDLDSCFSSNRTSLPGKPPSLSETGLRWFLDPRVADTDGDGLPDGFEVAMCMGETGYLNESHVWTCLAFDPLNSSDGDLDSDRCPDLTLGCGDGFDVDRDGVIEQHEFYTNAEEYSWGAPDNWTTEFDGLRWGERPTGDEGWLGTDPMRNDSDYYRWVGNRALAQTQKGDGIEDGWEVFFGLAPRNRSDAIRDNDLDGWDYNRDGAVSPDTSGATITLGEAFSNLEEYLVYLDDGNWVTAGVKSVSHGMSGEEVTVLDQGTNPMILHHDAHSLSADDENDLLYVGTQRGVTLIDAVAGSSTHLELPAGIDLLDMYRWEAGSTEGLLLLATTSGLATYSLESDGSIGPMIDEYEMEAVEIMAPLITGSGSLDLVAAGADQMTWRITLDEQGRIDAVSSVDQLTMALQTQNNTTVQAFAHTVIPGGGTHLFVGTNRGLLMANSTDLAGGFATSWIFDVTNAEDYVAPADIYVLAHSANVRSLVVDGPRDSNGEITSSQVLWVGTAGGVHQFDLLVGPADPLSGFSREGMRHTGDEDANDVYDILPLGTEVVIGSQWGTWVLDGDHGFVSGLDVDHTRIPGKIADLAVLDINGAVTLFAGLDPGRYANSILIDPLSNDSDADGMPDGWEFAFGLDPTNPYDRDDDADADGVNFDPDVDDYFDRSWTNLDEFRYVATTSEGWNSTDPRVADTDGDGLYDGVEYWGFFLEETNFTCYYLNSEYVCDEDTGNAARQVYIEGWQNSGSGGGTDSSTDPTNTDSDGDGMPDGWEIEYRRWIGSSFHGGNEWSLDPNDPSDADDDADGDGLNNLCEYKWQLVLDEAQLNGLASHNESSDAAQNWVSTDPNLKDSDMDGLPDGWEARYSCVWSIQNVGINPLNGSDAFNNPDGDGYDIDHDGVLQPGEQFNNWMEYYISTLIMLGNVSQDGIEMPHSTDLWDSSWTSSANEPFGTTVTGEVLSDTPTAPFEDRGSSDPLNRDTDGDGMPDGWEVWFARWDTFVENWTLNPVNELDASGDPDGDGMTNWEEYNSIDANRSETDPEKTSPQYYVIVAQGQAVLQVWNAAGSLTSFGAFVNAAQANSSGWTCDPNNPDSDGDGMLDGIEVLFTQWNQSDATWTLNPLVAGDGHYDADKDALTDLQELNLSVQNPVNGGLAPPDAPKMWEEAITLNQGAATARVYSMLFNKQGRALIALQQFSLWQQTGIAMPLLQTIIGITDPTNNDTDADGMIDGYEYWFTEWDLDGNRWQMNPLTDEDVGIDSDNDSWDCNRDGQIDDNETYDNLKEYQARIYGRYDQRFTIPASFGLIDYGDDAITAFQQENQMSYGDARGALHDMFVSKNVMSSERMLKINEANSDNWNRSLLGISDPTHSDSDLDGMPDGWEYCYSRYREVQPVNTWRWTLNPVNPLDVNYDPDEDGWFDRTSGDIPAPQGTWSQRMFSPGPVEDQISPGNGPIFFTNLQEWEWGTIPISNDSDADSVTMIHVGQGNGTVSYHRDWNLSDGREVYKYGTNPGDNDTDGDMLPDYYEYGIGWNETNDNYTSYRHIKVVWEDFGATKKPLNVTFGGNGLVLARPNFEWVWVTFDPRDPTDAVNDYDNDGGWDCSGPTCIYIPYNNFQEFYGNTTLTSATNVRSTPLLYNGQQITEWWQLRSWLLHIGQPDDLYENYFRMYRVNYSDDRFAHIVNDHDTDYMMLNPIDDTHVTRGDWTDDHERRFGTFDKFPDIGAGEYVWGWWHLDMDGDNIADGTDPLNFDTDGDWLNDWFEIDDDMLDGIRGNGGSPIRYDDRTTTG